MNTIKDQKRDILNPTKAEINLLVQGNVASGNVGFKLKELAQLDIETTLLRKRLRLKQHLLNRAYNDLLREATHEWTLDVDLRLEDTCDERKSRLISMISERKSSTRE